MKASGVSRTPSCAALPFERDPRDFEIGDVRIVVLRDVRQIEPARLQARTGDALDARQRLDLDGTELREIDFRHLGQRRACRGRAAVARAALDVRFHVVVRDAPLRARARDLAEVGAQLARELAHRRARVGLGERRLIDRRRAAGAPALRPRCPRLDARRRRAGGRGRLLQAPGARRPAASAARRRVGGGAAVASAAGASPAARRVGARRAPRAAGSRMPSDTLSPCLTLTCCDASRRRRGHVHRRLLRFERDHAASLCRSAGHP